MRRTSIFTVLAAAALTVPAAPVGSGVLTAAQAPAQTTDARLTVTCEVFCSDVKMRTSNARLRWTLADGAPQTAAPTTALRSLANTTQSLETTVFSGGFEKGLFVTLPVGPASADRPVQATRGPAAAQLQRRAFDIQLIEVESPADARTAGAQSGAVVEGLEPNVNYTWRLGVDTPAGRVYSEPIMCRPRVCPADLVDDPRPGPGPQDTPRPRR